MDTARQIRLITPAFFFFGSLLLGAWLGNSLLWLNSIEELKNLPPPTVVAIIGVVLAALFPLGFVITGVSTLLLEAFNKLSKSNYQISLSEDAWKHVSRALKLYGDLKLTRANQVYAAMTFDHEILHERIHDAAVRSWSAFNISVNSCTALILALLVGSLALSIRLTCGWVGTTAFLLVLFGLCAVVTWNQQMSLLEFQSYRIDEDGLMPHQKLKDPKTSS